MCPLQKFTKDLESNREDLITYLGLALAGANLGIWDWYLTDNSVKFDRRWAEMLGLDYTKIEMKLSTWESRVHPEDLAKAYADIKAYMDGKTSQYENIHRMKHADGHWVYILDRGRFSGWDKNGKPIRFTGTHFDLTNYERNRKKLSLFFDHSPFGYAFCDMEGQILDANKRYSDITGYTLPELKELAYWDITPKEYETQDKQQLVSLKKTGRYGPYRKEYRHKNGSLIPVELNGFLVDDYDGSTGIWSTVEDISEKRLLESQLIRTSKLASIGTLAAGIGHEINNPLAVATLVLEKLKIRAGDNAETLKDIAVLENSMQRIATIVTRLRTFTRMGDNQFSPVHIDNTIRETVLLMSNLLNAESVHVDLALEQKSRSFVNGIVGRLQQVLINLINNAKDATEGRSKRIISIQSLETNDHIIVSIRDNGSGIPAHLIDKVFDPFFTTKDTNRGTGLGLSIAHSIVSEHQGELAVESTEGVGTTFTIKLPVMKSLPKDMQTEVSIANDSPTLRNDHFRNKKVMVVDDEEHFRKTLSGMLLSMGLKVDHHKDGAEAFKAYKKSPSSYDLIISDVRMPNVDGVALLKKIRKSSSTHHPKFLLITGGVNVDLAATTNKYRTIADAFIYKPFTMTVLRAKLEELLATPHRNRKTRKRG